MDATSQQATAIIREGDPSRPRPNGSEVKIDAADASKKSESVSKSKDVSGGTDKKKKSGIGKKKHSGARGLEKEKRKKKKVIVTASSSDSAEASSDDSDSDSEEDDSNAIFHKPATKKVQDARKTKRPGKVKNVPFSGKATAQVDSDSSEYDSNAEGEEEDEGEAEDATRARTGRNSKKSKSESHDPRLIDIVSREVQRALGQIGQAQIQHQAPFHSSVGGMGHLTGGGEASGLRWVAIPTSAYDLGSSPGLFPHIAGRSPWPAGGNARNVGRAPLAKSAGLDESPDATGDPTARSSYSAKSAKNASRGSAAKNTTPKNLDYKRVDQVWDNAIHNFKLQDTAKFPTETRYDGFCFHVRRTFDWEGKYKCTVVDIKSKALRECLQDVLGNIKGVSLVDETPKIDPNVLFLYLEDLRKQCKALRKQAANLSGYDKPARRKEAKRLEEKRQSLKVLVKYIDKDYETVKNSLHPMLEHGLITFDLLWALWKPNTLAYTPTYGSHDEPRAFKVDTAEKHLHITRGEFYVVDGRYFEYDGKQFGHGHMAEEIPEFKGAKKITSLNCYPLKYHKSEAKLRLDLIERGKKFVTLAGVQYKSHQGMAYFKKKRNIVKVNVNGRVMVDAAIHRRINPNYPISIVRPKEHELLSDDEDSDDDEDCGRDGSDGDVLDQERELDEDDEKVKYVTKFFKDDKGRGQFVRMTKEEAEEFDKEKIHKVESHEDEAIEGSDKEGKPKTDNKKVPTFTDEEYLIASPVVLGFSFGEKLWLEFTVSGIKDISWNENAYDSLVLEPKTKETVKALVESHKYHATESIDDVIQGKGKGLVAVLHGPPGTGKTLTAEGISELLKCPLYMVSAGELGTDSRVLEGELQRILDICHAWGAILLLDEADVFLEKRNMADIHRNALVSIFLRQLEYFQGILFLTTNRVQTFDEAFQSRIHIALRYDTLDRHARKAIFKMFVERARAQQQKKADSNKTEDPITFTEDEFDRLARHDLNGRQIKNIVIRAQALAVNKGEPLAMEHVRQILDVQKDFEQDLKGGPGYQEAMRGYV